MRHFAHLDDEVRARIFRRPPEGVDLDGPRDRIALALGGTLYMPATRPDLLADLRRCVAQGVTSVVWCLEDAIEHAAVPDAERAVVRALTRLDRDPLANAPLVFVRVRDEQQISRLVAALGPAVRRLAGVSLPKADLERAEPMLAAVREASVDLERPLYAMPILESDRIAFNETRRHELPRLARLFDLYDEHVLCVRVGGTDLSGVFGLRRDRDTTIWDLAVVRDAVADIVNQFVRHGDRVVSGAVWEHVSGQRLFKPQLRNTPFEQQGASTLRGRLVRDHVDGLLREVSLDRANGLLGKTVIHPTHAPIVNALLTVHRDEWDDACAVLERASAGGVLPSAGGGMNEVGPHRRWAEGVVARADVYGVLAEDAALVDLLAQGQEAVWRSLGVPAAEGVS